jgi:hypothetical protein
MYNKVSLLLILFLLSIYQVQAQVQKDISPKQENQRQEKNGIDLYYGYFSNQQYFGVIAGIISETFSSLGESNEINGMNLPGVFGVSYNRMVKKRLRLGVDYNYVGLTLKIRDSLTLQDKHKNHLNFHTLKFNVGANYLKKNLLTLYGGVSIGVCLINFRQKNVEGKILDKGTSVIPRPAWHINLLGIEVGKKVSGYMNVGIGYNGIINLGARFAL